MMCQDTTGTDADVKPHIAEERTKFKKRKLDTDPWSSTHKKNKQGMSEMMDTDSDSENSDGFANEDDITMNSNSSNEDVGHESSLSQNEFISDLELSGMDAADALGAPDNRTSSDMDNSNDGDVEDIIRYIFWTSFNNVKIIRHVNTYLCF